MGSRPRYLISCVTLGKLLNFSASVLSFVKYRHPSFYCVSLHWNSQVLCVLQTESKMLHQQKYYDSLYYDICFIMVVWNRT